MSNMDNGDTNNSQRIPNLPLGQIADENGFPTEEEKNFRQALITLLQNLFGNEGMVPPSQSATDIAAIAAGTQQVQGAIDSPIFTMQPGTIIFDATNGNLITNIPVLGVPTIRVFALV